MAGAEVGLKPNEIYDMEYWEFNFYMKGYREKLYHDDINIMKLAYNTGMLSRESKKKPKSLEHYLNEIDKAYHKGMYKDVPVDKEKSKSIYKKIQELKEKEVMDSGE